MLSLHGESGSILFVAGGAGQLLVEFQNADQSMSYSLINPHGDPATMAVIVAGGQQAEFSERFVVEPHLALEVMLEYLHDGDDVIRARQWRETELG